MGKEKAYQKMFEAVKVGDTDNFPEAINEIIDNADLLEIIQPGMMPGLKHIGELFETGEVFLPEMLMAAETFQEGM